VKKVRTGSISGSAKLGCRLLPQQPSSRPFIGAAAHDPKATFQPRVIPGSGGPTVGIVAGLNVSTIFVLMITPPRPDKETARPQMAQLFIGHDSYERRWRAVGANGIICKAHRLPADFPEALDIPQRRTGNRGGP
jgi:hypothetical protein